MRYWNQGSVRQQTRNFSDLSLPNGWRQPPRGLFTNACGQDSQAQKADQLAAREARSGRQG